MILPSDDEDVPLYLIWQPALMKFPCSYRISSPILIFHFSKSEICLNYSTRLIPDGIAS